MSKRELETGNDGHETLSLSVLLRRLSEPSASATQFLSDLLSTQCLLSRARAGAVLRIEEKGKVGVLFAHPDLPDPSSVPDWLRLSAQFAQTDELKEDGIVRDLPESGKRGKDTSSLLLLPLDLPEAGRLVEVFLLSSKSMAAFEQVRANLALASRLAILSRNGGGSALESQGQLGQLQQATEVLAAINQHTRFSATAMAFCNEIASRWQCERVSIGFLKGRYVRIEAISHTEHFSRKMKLVQAIECVMEECLDQDSEVFYPADESAVFISRAARELSVQDGQTAILSLPLRLGGEPVAVVTLERQQGKPFDLQSIGTARLASNLCSPRLLNLHKHDRWLGARIAAGIRGCLACMVGPQHTFAKVLGILVLGALLFLTFAKGQYKVEAPFVVEAVEQQKICAPFDGFISTVDVEIGDAIEADQTVLAELDTVELVLQLASASAEHVRYVKEEDAAMQAGKTSEAHIAAANAEKALAQTELLEYFIEQAVIRSPLSGRIVQGDLKHNVGAPVKTGDVMFEIAPIESLRAELLVPEDQISDVEIDQEGLLATASYPGQRFQFVVERLNPAAEVVKNRNVFKVRARLLETKPWLRPGMEGVAKISVDRRRYIWIWTRRVVNWLRMKLWL